MESQVNYFFHGDLPYADSPPSRRYIHVVEEGPEECPFDPAEAPDYKMDFMQQIHGTES